MDLGHTWKWNFHLFCFLFVCELVRHKSGANLSFTQIIADDVVRWVLANAKLLHNLSWRQSPILCQHLSHFLDHFGGFACQWLTRMWLNPQSFPSLCKNVWTIPKHIFCSRLPYRTLAPTFHVSLLQFSLICSRTWCLHVATLRCDTTVPLTLTTFNWQQSMLCVDSAHVPEEPYACAPTCVKLPFRYHTIHRTFFVTPCISIWLKKCLDLPLTPGDCRDCYKIKEILYVDIWFLR